MPGEETLQQETYLKAWIGEPSAAVIGGRAGGGETRGGVTGGGVTGGGVTGG